MRALILPSPLLGPATYRPLADALTAAGRPTSVAPVTGRTVRAVTTGFAEHAADVDVVVAHSNAGRFAAAIAPPQATVVYLDATLPDTGLGAEFRSFLLGIADPDGVLPGWTDWWPSEEIDELLGDWRGVVEAEQGRWPLAFLADPSPGSDWTVRPSSYVAFGPGYEQEAARAESLGWPVRRLEGHHLHHLTDPDEVAETILDLTASR